jgi:two-component system, cell cycle response regulator
VLRTSFARCSQQTGYHAGVPRLPHGYAIASSDYMRVVIAEDSKVYRALMKRLFEEWGLACVFAADGAEAWDLLRDQRVPTLALLDWVLPKLDGIGLCRKIRTELGIEHYTYTILITSKGRKEDVVEALEAGADDYLVKPFYAPELKARVLAGRRILDLESTLLQTQESLRVAATHDALTGLKNRMEIVGMLQQELARSTRSGAPVSVIFVDVDHFKLINDSIGHLAGDSVLKAVSRRLASTVRTYDHVGRYGGEEFLVVLPGCDLVDARNRAEELLRMVRKDPIETSQGFRNVTVSIGIASTSGRGDTGAEILLHQADQALYRAKGNGRNRVEGPLPALEPGTQAISPTETPVLKRAQVDAQERCEVNHVAHD